MSLHKMDEVKIFQRFQGTELSTPIAKFICTMYDALQSLKYQRIMRNIIATDVGLEMRDLTWPEIVFCRSFKPIKIYRPLAAALFTVHDQQDDIHYLACGLCSTQVDNQTSIEMCKNSTNACTFLCIFVQIGSEITFKLEYVVLCE